MNIKNPAQAELGRGTLGSGGAVWFCDLPYGFIPNCQNRNEYTSVNSSICFVPRLPRAMPRPGLDPADWINLAPI